MEVEIVKWGNSSAIRLPAVALKSIHAKAGDRFELKTEGGKLVLEPSAREYDLEQLISGITNENCHQLVPVTGPVGREIW